MNFFVKKCPFCGFAVDITNPDTFHPNGLGWIVTDGFVQYDMKQYVSHREVPKEQWCYVLRCPEIYGGCGAEIHGDSKQECLDKWNKRA